MNTDTRLSLLERQVRAWRNITLAIAACAIGFGLYGFGQDKPVAEVIQAKKFELVDAKGKVMARIENYEGSGAVTTYNSDGKILVDLVPSKSGAGGIVVYNGKGAQNLVVTDVEGGGGSIRINNGSAATAVSLGRNNNQAGSITIYNKSGKAIGLITGDTADAGAVIMSNADGGQTARLPSGG